MNILAELRRRFETALVDATGDAESAALAEMVLPSQDSKFGDYQANCAMPLGKKLGKPPREIAAAIVGKLEVADLCEPPQIAGPGFINLKLKDDALAGLVQQAWQNDRLGVLEARIPRTYVIDYSAPNVAKPMHVGHIRSTVIGAALYRVLAFLGHRVISDNHIGDWGTQFGMILYGWKHLGDERALAKDPVGELSRLYRHVNHLITYHTTKNETIPAVKQQIEQLQGEVERLRSEPSAPGDKKAAKRLEEAEHRLLNARLQLELVSAVLPSIDDFPALRRDADAHPDIGRAVLVETAKLHHGDAENIALWRRFLPPASKKSTPPIVDWAWRSTTCSAKVSTKTLCQAWLPS